MNTFRSRQHKIYTERVNKIAFSADDDKRIIMDDGVKTKASGHYQSEWSQAMWMKWIIM